VGKSADHDRARVARETFAVVGCRARDMGVDSKECERRRGEGSKRLEKGTGLHREIGLGSVEHASFDKT